MDSLNEFIIIINQGTDARRCPMPFLLFDVIFVSPKQHGIVLVLMHHAILLYCPSILSLFGRPLLLVLSNLPNELLTV